MRAIPDNYLTEEPIFPHRRCKYCHMLMNDCICEEIFQDDDNEDIHKDN